jgi:hypothetical protein
VKRFRYCEVLVHIFVVVRPASNLAGQKITAVEPFRIGAAQIVFPVTCSFGGICTEVYG